jgi:uncharacterized protein (UPF0210 family)
MARTLTYYSPQYVSDVLTPEYKIVFGVAPYHLEEVSGLGSSDINMVSQSLPLQHGAQFSRLQYEPRMITISGKLTGSITTQNANKATMSKALAYNNQAVREAWQADFWRLKAADSGITSAAQFVDFLYNLGGYGVIKYTSSGITTTKRINAIPYSGPVFKNKDGREPYQDFQIVFMAPYPFFEDDAYTLAIDEQDDSLTVDFEIEGDIPPRMVLHVEPRIFETNVSNNLELTINARQNYTPEIAATAYVPTMIDMKSTAAIKGQDILYQSFINGEKQMYIDRTANKIAVAVGTASPYIATSTNGVDWTNATTVVGTYWRSISWSASLGRFVAVGAASPYIATSTDGVNWANAITVVGTNWRSISWSASLGRFVAVGTAAPYIATSTDGVNWASAITVVGTKWTSVAWSLSLGRFVAVGYASPYIATSTDGVNWADAITVVGTNWQGLGWSDPLGRFVAVGDASPYIATSTDGVNWANATTVVGDFWEGVSWSDSLGRFVITSVNSPYIATSTNGVDWTNATTVVGTNWLGVSWSASLGRFVAVGTAAPYIATSTDGVNWANATTVVGTSWLGVSSFPEPEQGPDTNSKLTRFRSLDCPPGDYRATMKADKIMNWKLYYRKAWLGI